MPEDPIADAFAASNEAPTLLDAWHGFHTSVREATVYLEQLEQQRDQAREQHDRERADVLEEIIEDIRANVAQALRWP